MNLGQTYKELAAQSHDAALAAIYKLGFDEGAASVVVAEPPAPPPAEPEPFAPAQLLPQIELQADVAEVSSDALVDANTP